MGYTDLREDFRTKFLQRRMFLHLPIHAVVTTASFGFALPIAIALFPQRSKISTTEVEPELRSKTTQQYLYYNKGL